MNEVPGPSIALLSTASWLIPDINRTRSALGENEGLLHPDTAGQVDYD